MKNVIYKKFSLVPTRYFLEMRSLPFSTLPVGNSLPYSPVPHRAPAAAECRFGTVYVREQGRHVNAERFYYVVHDDPDRLERLQQRIRADMSYTEHRVVNNSFALVNTNNNREIQTPDQLSAALHRNSPLHVAYRIQEGRPAPAKRSLPSQPPLEIMRTENEPALIETMSTADRYKHTLGSLKQMVGAEVAAHASALAHVKKGFPLELYSPAHDQVHAITRKVMSEHHDELRQLGAHDAAHLANQMSIDLAHSVCATNRQMLARQPEAAIRAEVGRSTVWSAMEDALVRHKESLKPDRIGAEQDSDCSSCDDAPVWTTTRASKLNLNVNVFVSGKDVMPTPTPAASKNALEAVGFKPFASNEYQVEMGTDQQVGASLTFEDNVAYDRYGPSAGSEQDAQWKFESYSQRSGSPSAQWKFEPYAQRTAEDFEPVGAEDFEPVGAEVLEPVGDEAWSRDGEEFDLVREKQQPARVGKWMWWKKPSAKYTGTEPPAQLIVYNREASEGLEVWVDDAETGKPIQATDAPIEYRGKSTVWLKPGARHVYYRRVGTEKNLYDAKATFKPNTRYSIVIGLPWSIRPRHMAVPWVSATAAPSQAQVRAEMPTGYSVSLVNAGTDNAVQLTGDEYSTISPGAKKLRVTRNGRSVDMPTAFLAAPGQVSFILGQEDTPGQIRCSIATEADAADDLYQQHEALRRTDLPDTDGIMFLNADTGAHSIGHDRGAFHKATNDECTLTDEHGQTFIFDGKRTMRFDDDLDSEPMAVHAVLAHPHQPKMTVVVMAPTK